MHFLLQIYSKQIIIEHLFAFPNKQRQFSCSKICCLCYIQGWQNICCDATLGDTGIVSTPNVCTWFRVKNFNSQIQKSNEDLPTELKIKK